MFQHYQIPIFESMALTELLSFALKSQNTSADIYLFPPVFSLLSFEFNHDVSFRAQAVVSQA